MNRHSRWPIVVLLAMTWLGHSGAIPDFTLKALDGSAFKLSSLSGQKILIIDFWATWCQPCKELLKRLQAIKNQFAQVEVIAISVDEASAIGAVSTFIQAKRFDFIVLLDPDSTVAKMFNPSRKVPFTLIVDRQGDIIYSHSGYVPGMEREIVRRIEALPQ